VCHFNSLQADPTQLEEFGTEASFEKMKRKEQHQADTCTKHSGATGLNNKNLALAEKLAL
jgi:hypothetical protein